MRVLQRLTKHRILLFLITAFFLLRFSWLGSLPIYTDESVYLDWSWRATHTPGELFYSLYDGKPPLLMWIFGIFESFLPEPLIAGRIVAVFAGLFALLGIYVLAKKYVDEKTAIVAAWLYIVIPIFSFFDRQVLFESAVGAIGVWSCFLLLKLFEQEKAKSAYVLGLLFGIGIFIKSSSYIFVMVALSFIVIRWRGNPRALFSLASVLMLGILSTAFLLFLQPAYWGHAYDERNQEHFRSLNNMLSFPLQSWVSNVIGNIEIMFFFLTPLVFIASLAGVWMLLTEKGTLRRVMVLWVGCGLGLQILFLQEPIQRYLVPFLPLMTVFAAYSIHDLKKRRFQIMTIVLLIIPLGITLLQIISPLTYFSFLSNISRYSDRENYVTGINSGYGIDEVVTYLKAQAGDQPAFVTTAVNSGNPESAVKVAFLKSKTIKTGYLDSRLFDKSIYEYECLSFPVPVYFVSRNAELVGLDKYLLRVKHFANPQNPNVIGVYKIKENCQGKTAHLQTEG